jgi:cyclohexadienyl dehydratase
MPGSPSRSVLTVLLAVLVSVMTSCQANSPAPAALDRIRGAGTVRVCSTGDYRPFSYRDPQGHWSGTDIDLAGDLAHRLGATLQLVATTWSSMVHDLDSRCDLAMGGITVTSDRARQALFSAPYLRDGKAAVVRCVDISHFHSLSDVDQSDVRVVVNPGGTNASFDATNLHRAKIVEYADNNTIFEQIADGHADAMITDASEIRWQTTRLTNLCGVNVDHPFTVEQKAYLMRRSEIAFQQWINQWLNIIASDGTYARISAQWLGSPGGQ